MITSVNHMKLLGLYVWLPLDGTNTAIYLIDIF